jgi:hypothetical protein
MKKDTGGLKGILLMKSLLLLLIIMFFSCSRIEKHEERSTDNNNENIYDTVIIEPQKLPLTDNEYFIDYNNKIFNNVDVLNNLKLTIQLPNVGEEYKTNKNTIRIKCTIENISGYPEEVFLQDHHDYHGTLNYPTSFYITIKDEQGNIITNEFHDYFFWSSEFKEYPGDRMILHPGDKVIRFVRLKDIVGGNINKMDNGKYYINIVLIYSDRNENIKKYISNTLEINILK